MQWIFLGICIAAAAIEAHVGTLWFASLAFAGGISFAAGFWMTDIPLVALFLGTCALGTATAWWIGRRRRGEQAQLDFDVGHEVVVGHSASGGLTATYRGVVWEAAMDDGSLPEPGSKAIIARRSDKTLWLIRPQTAALTAGATR